MCPLPTHIRNFLEIWKLFLEKTASKHHMTVADMMLSYNLRADGAQGTSLQEGRDGRTGREKKGGVMGRRRRG